MDSVGLLVGIVAGGLLTGGAAYIFLKSSRSAEEDLKLETAEALAKAQAAEIERATLEERCRRLVDLEAEAATKDQVIDEWRGQVNELRLKEQQHAESLDNERKRLADREELVQKTVNEKIEFLETKEKELKEAFEALANDALRKSRADFLEMAEERMKSQTEQAKAELDKRQTAIDVLFKPLNETLKDYRDNILKIEEKRSEQTTKLAEQIEMVTRLQKDQASATSDLKGLLRGPTTRGRIGEMFLKTLLDSVGLQQNIHYRLQVSTAVEENRARPDCVVFLPSGKCLVIDAKTPLNAYEEAYSSQDEVFRATKLREHARNLRGEIDRLSKRAYEDVDMDVEHVVMYLPIEASLAAAYDVDPDIHTFGWNKSVVLASPTLLYLFLHMVRNDWRQHQLAENAREIEKLGGEMVDRIRVVADHFRAVGRGLETATASYNEAVGSVDRNLLTTAARLQELGAKGKKKSDPPAIIDRSVRSFDKPQLQSLPPAERIAELDATLPLILDEE